MLFLVPKYLESIKDENSLNFAFTLMVIRCTFVVKIKGWVPDILELPPFVVLSIAWIVLV